MRVCPTIVRDVTAREGRGRPAELDDPAEEAQGECHALPRAEPAPSRPPLEERGQRLDADGEHDVMSVGAAHDVTHRETVTVGQSIPSRPSLQLAPIDQEARLAAAFTREHAREGRFGRLEAPNRTGPRGESPQRLRGRARGFARHGPILDARRRRDRAVGSGCGRVGASEPMGRNLCGR